jgi:alcohol dehydrogenase, propanol-preferring
MQAIVLERPGEQVRPATLLDPTPGPDQLLLEVAACAVCRTDLHLRDGEIDAPKLPVVLGHQIVGRAPDGTRYGVP